MKSVTVASAFAFALCLSQAAIQSGTAQPSTDSTPRPVATVSTGQLRGSLTYDGVAVFKNIPFAEAPVGKLRWHEPLPPKPWEGIRDASLYGPACYQTGHLNVVSSEDCLQLNIWTPKWPVKAAVPVMVWFHGGGNIAGSAIEPLFNGENFARHGVILVSANYRLGVFGFFAHPELTQESPHRSSGNYGLLDQIQALRWVQENISKFGGDPANVTIFGESAGSMDVNSLLAAPIAKGLFVRAIAESGAAGEAQPLSESEKAGQALAAKFNINGDGALEKLRALTSEELVKSVQLGPGTGGMLGINVDGWVLPESPAKAFAAGHELPVGLLFGNNSQELQKPFGPASDDVRTAISKRFGKTADRVLAAYGLNGTADPQPDAEYGTIGAQWATDAAFRCATVQELLWHTAASNTAYEYQFSRTVHGKESEGAPHASEIPFVFGTLPAWQEMRNYNLSDRQYAPMVQEYWVNFAKTGDPNGAGLTKWPKFDGTSRAYLDFLDAGPVAKEGLRRQVCDAFLESQK